MRLPVSGIEVQVRQPGGTEDVLLAEAPAFDVALALALAGSVASPADGGTPEGQLLKALARVLPGAQAPPSA